MPITPDGVVTYLATFTANGIDAGFDINQSGYGETVEANITIRPIPWSTVAAYAVSLQMGGLNPIRRTYQATLYTETDYGALRSLVGWTGLLSTIRETDLTTNIRSKAAILTSVRRGNFQYPAWPHPGDGKDLQTVILDFIMLET